LQFIKITQENSVFRSIYLTSNNVKPRHMRVKLQEYW